MTDFTYVNLPNDPYRCHPDPCTSNHIAHIFDETKGICDPNCKYVSDSQDNQTLYITRPPAVEGQNK